MSPRLPPEHCALWPPHPHVPTTSRLVSLPLGVACCPLCQTAFNPPQGLVTPLCFLKADMVSPLAWSSTPACLHLLHDASAPTHAQSFLPARSPPPTLSQQFHYLPCGMAPSWQSGMTPRMAPALPGSAHAEEGPLPTLGRRVGPPHPG